MNQRAEQVADRILEIVSGWDWFAKQTVGVQLVDAADSIGANIAESAGRFHPKDVRNFLYHARESLRETKLRMRRALRRRLITADDFSSLDAELEQLSHEINAEIRHQQQRMVREERAPYLTEEEQQEAAD